MAGTYKVTRADTVKFTSDVSPHRFVNGAKAQAGVDDICLGVSQTEAKNGESGAVSIEGKEIVMSGAAVAEGVYVMPDAAGKGIAATAGKQYGGFSLNAVTGADQELMIDLCRGQLNP